VIARASDHFSANEPDVKGCPKNSCYTIDNGKCVANEECYHVNCRGGAAVEFKFKTDFLLRDKERFTPSLRAGKLDQMFSLQNDEGWVAQCANATFAPLADDGFDYVFTTSDDNSCYHLKQKRINGDIKLMAQFVLGGTNKHPGSPIIFGRKIKFDFECPLNGGNLMNKSSVEKMKKSGIRQQMMFVGAIFAMMLVFAAVHIYVQKRHRNEMLLLKNKVF